MQPVTPSATDVTVEFYVLDSTTFLPYESLTSATSGLALWYRKGALGAVTAITESDLAAITSVHSDGGIKHADDGRYRLDLPDAAIPTAEHEVTTFGGTATGYVILGGALVGRYGVGAAGAGLTALGDARLANLDAAVSTRATPAQVNTEADTALSDVGLTTTITGRIDAAISSRLASAGYTTPPTVGAIADQVWDEALAGHLTAGTTGKALSDAGAAGDPWSTDLDAGGYAAGTAGDILLDLQGGTVYATGSTPNTDAALSIRNADTVAVTIGDLTGLAAGWDSLLVTIKKSKHDPDSAAILQVRVNVATPTLPGIVYINGQGPVAAGVLATDAWISDVDGGADTLVLNIKPAASVLLPVRGALWWNVKQLDGTTWTSLATGEESAEITPGITQAIS